jgi:hypothetical protein
LIVILFYHELKKYDTAATFKLVLATYGFALLERTRLLPTQAVVVPEWAGLENIGLQKGRNT